ncbi:SRG-3 protein [Aphelenchoides avenae]|nr:SRG-3 protein [Aphelenchus avenae]
MLPTYIAISIPVELVFLAFHISVWYFIAYQISRRNATFSSAFFVVYALQCFADVGNYLTMMYKERFCKYGLLPADMRPTPLISTIVYFCLGYFSSFQFIGHCVIAVNRYTCMIHPTVHSKIWSGKSLVLVSALVVALPVAVSSVRWFMQCDVVDVPGGYALVPKNPVASKISGVAQVSVSLFTCLLSCVLEYRTFFAFRTMSSKCKRQYGDDYRLLLYAMMGFFAHVIMATVYVFVYIVGWLPDCLVLGYPYFVDILCLSGPVFLFYTSKHLRRKYLQFYGLKKHGAREMTVTAVETTKVLHR